MPQDEKDEARKRYDAEEERHYWESVEDDKRAEEERQAERREAAIEEMDKWFFEQFEDPQIETPRNGEDQEYVYAWGGPFEALDVLHSQFSSDYEESWIIEAVERIERDGTTEWAPTSTGDYYEPPDPDIDDGEVVATAQLTAQILDRLTKLEEIVGALPGLPGNIGHNFPPDEIGLPPYSEVALVGVSGVISEARAELAQPVPDATKLVSFARRLGRQNWCLASQKRRSRSR